MIKPYTLEESNQLLDDISMPFISFLNDLLDLTGKNRVCFVGVGNSISAGWTAVDHHVQPWLEKLRPYLEPEVARSGISLDFGTFSIAAKNSNEQIYQFLSSNPSLRDVKNHFLQVFDDWKIIFHGTPFENYVDKEIASSFYFDCDKKFADFFGDDILTISNFNGCTGELLQNINMILRKDGLSHIFEKEFFYLNQILYLLFQQSASSFVVVGNFPKMTRKILSLFSIPIHHINQQIFQVVKNYEQAMFFEGIYMDFINVVQGHIKLDNHPNLVWQYTSLYYYLVFLMKQLPFKVAENDQALKLVKKYEPYMRL